MTSTINLAEFNSVHWLEPWQRTSPGLEVELAKELPPQHPLFRRRAVSVARRCDNDDVLFFLPDGAPPLAVVHLTWKGSPAASPHWPWTTFYASIAEWIDNCLRPDHLAQLGEAESAGS